jgi:hypothetical protein
VSSSAPLDGVEGRSCPPWCTTGAQHLAFRLGHGMDDYWHEGVEYPHPTLDTDHNWHPIDLQLRLGQREHDDEHGHLRHPVYVDCGGYSLSPTQARARAAGLLRLADAAEQGAAEMATTPRRAAMTCRRGGSVGNRLPPERFGVLRSATQW